MSVTGPDVKRKVMEGGKEGSTDNLIESSSERRKERKNHIRRCRSLPTICFFLYSLRSFVRSSPETLPQPAKGTTRAVKLSSDPISSAKARTRWAASRGVFAPLARSDISSSETTDDMPSESSVRCEYSAPVNENF